MKKLILLIILITSIALADIGDQEIGGDLYFTDSEGGNISGANDIDCNDLYSGGNVFVEREGYTDGYLYLGHSNVCQPNDANYPHIRGVYTATPHYSGIQLFAESIDFWSTSIVTIGQHANHIYIGEVGDAQSGYRLQIEGGAYIDGDLNVHGDVFTGVGTVSIVNDIIYGVDGLSVDHIDVNEANDTDLVTNFNADLLDGQEGSYYASASGYVPYTGATQTIDVNSQNITDINHVDCNTIDVNSATDTDVVTNFNADLWDGYQFADYLDQAVKTTSSPSLAGLTIDNININGHTFTSSDSVFDFDDDAIYFGSIGKLSSGAGNTVYIGDTNDENIIIYKSGDIELDGDVDIDDGHYLEVNGVEVVGADGEINAAALEDKFLRNDGDDTTSGALTASGGFVGNLTGNASGSSGSCTGNAATATALAANGSNASAGYAILGVDASGNAEGAFDVWTETENTAAGYISGNETITLSGDATGSGETAITVTVVDDSHNHVITNIDAFTEAQLQTQLSDVTDVYTNNDGSLDDDDVTAADVGTVSDNLDDTDASVEWEDAANLESDGSLSNDVVAVAEFLASQDWGDMSTAADGTVSLDNDVVNTDEMGDGDYGDFTFSGGSATLDSDVVDSAEITANAVKASELDVSDVSDDIAGDIAEGELADAIIVEADLKAVDAAADEDILTYETTTGDFEWHSGAELGIGTATSITDGLIVEPDLDADNSPSDGDILTYDSTGTNFAWITQNAGTDITADLEEEVTEGSLADSTIVSADIKDGVISDEDIDFNDITLNDLTFDVGSVDKTEFGYLNGVSSAIQTQFSNILDGTTDFTKCDVDNLSLDGQTITGTGGSITMVGSLIVAPAGGGTANFSNTKLSDDSDNFRVDDNLELDGAYSLIVNAVEIVGIDGEVNKAAVEDSGNWDTAYGWGDHSVQHYFDGDVNDLDDIPDGTTYKLLTATKEAYIDQDVTTTGTPTFATLSTGQGQYELYAMNQDLETTDSPSFAGLTVDTDTIYVDSVNHRLGINNSSPSYDIEVGENATSDTYLIMNSDGDGQYLDISARGSGSYIITHGSGNYLDIAALSSYIHLASGSGQSMYLDCGGSFYLRDKDAGNAVRVTIASATGNTTIEGTLTVNGDQTGATDNVFDDYNDIELLEKWRNGEELPFNVGDMLNRDRLLRDTIIQQNKIIQDLQKRVEELEARE